MKSCVRSAFCSQLPYFGRRGQFLAFYLARQGSVAGVCACACEMDYPNPKSQAQHHGLGTYTLHRPRHAESFATLVGDVLEHSDN